VSEQLKRAQAMLRVKSAAEQQAMEAESRRRDAEARLGKATEAERALRKAVSRLRRRGEAMSRAASAMGLDLSAADLAVHASRQEEASPARRRDRAAQPRPAQGAREEAGSRRASPPALPSQVPPSLAELVDLPTQEAPRSPSRGPARRPAAEASQSALDALLASQPDPRPPAVALLASEPDSPRGGFEYSDAGALAQSSLVSPIGGAEHRRRRQAAARPRKRERHSDTVGSAGSAGHRADLGTSRDEEPPSTRARKEPAPASLVAMAAAVAALVSETRRRSAPVRGAVEGALDRRAEVLASQTQYIQQASALTPAASSARHPRAAAGSMPPPAAVLLRRPGSHRSSQGRFGLGGRASLLASSRSRHNDALGDLAARAAQASDSGIVRGRDATGAPLYLRRGSHVAGRAAISGGAAKAAAARASPKTQSVLGAGKTLW